MPRPRFSNIRTAYSRMSAYGANVSIVATTTTSPRPASARECAARFRLRCLASMTLAKSLTGLVSCGGGACAYTARELEWVRWARTSASAISDMRDTRRSTNPTIPSPEAATGSSSVRSSDRRSRRCRSAALSASGNPSRNSPVCSWVTSAFGEMPSSRATLVTSARNGGIAAATSLATALRSPAASI